MIVKSIKHGRHVLKSLLLAKWLAQDTETQPKPEWRDDPQSTLIYDRFQIKIFSICHKGISYSFPTDCIAPEYPSIDEWAEIFCEYFAKNPDCVCVYHNGNYDIRILTQSGWNNPRLFWDTMISSWMSNGNEDKGLKARAPFYGRYIRDTKTINFNDLAELADYAEGDVIVTDEIYQQHKFGEVVRPQRLVFMCENGNWSVPVKNPVGEFKISPPTEKLTAFDRMFLQRQEFPILRSTIEAENHGVPFNLQKLKGIRAQMTKDLEDVTKRIYRHAGRKFQLTSNKQKIEVLTELGLNITKKTKKGAPSVNFDSMLSLQGQHPIIQEFMDFSKIEKLRSTYIGEEGFEYYYNPKTGCIHPSLNTVGAVTGRFSSSMPNLQNVPARNDRYKIRECFEAPKGQLFVCMDFSQIELRIMALLCKDPKMCKVLNDPQGDLHQQTADGMHVPRDPSAKQCNFLLIFRGGAYALQTGLRMAGQNESEETCQGYVDGFDRLYPNVRAFWEHQDEFHRKNGFVYLLTGRRRVIEDLDSQNRWKRHQAECQLANNTVQGSAQDVAKALIIRTSINRPNFDKIMAEDSSLPREHRLVLKDYAHNVEKFRKEFRLAKIKWRLQVHDEVLHTCDSHAALDVGNRISEMMTWRPYFAPITTMDVALRGEGGVGPTWGLAKKPKDPKMHIASRTMFWGAHA